MHSTRAGARASTQLAKPGEAQAGRRHEGQERGMLDPRKRGQGATTAERKAALSLPPT